MPQEFRVVQCYNCKAFQVDITKKVPKWSCKICGEKQSVKKIYGIGNAKECRLYVQDLNEKRIRFETEKVPNVCHLENKMQEQLLTNEEEGSKWLEFMQNSENIEDIIYDNIEKSSVNKSNEGILVNCKGKRELETNNRNYMQEKQLLINEEQGSKWLEFMRQSSENNENSCDNIEKSSVNKSNEAIFVNCNGKRELETNNLNYKKFKPNSDVKKTGVKDVSSKNIFDSENNYDIDSLLDI